jgi:ABC-type phosphate transport system auxiliary subunit
MAVDDIREQVRRTLEGLMSAEEASYLMDRPPGGWSDLVTKDYLDARLDALRGELRTEIAGVRTELADLRTQLERQTVSMLRWIVPTVFAAIVASSIFS